MTESNMHKSQNVNKKLLKAIKELIHSPIRAKYAYTTLTDAFELLLNIKQQENEGLLDHTARYKQERDILKEYTGNDILYQFVEHTDKYRNKRDTIVQQNLKDGSFNQWIMYKYMKNADMHKYSTLISK